MTKDGLRQILAVSVHTITPPDSTGASMVSMEEVMCKLNSMQLDFGVKLDNIGIRLNGMTDTLTALESEVTEVKHDVSTNTALIKKC